MNECIMNQTSMNRETSFLFNIYITYIIMSGNENYTTNNCKCHGASRIPLVVQCRVCQQYPLEKNSMYGRSDANQKRIWKASRVDQSQYLASISSLNVYTPPIFPSGVNWNQMSDRAVPGVVKHNVPSRGNSTKYSITRERPGSQSAPGKGVDVKHGSYHRYLERLKGKGPSRTQSVNENVPMYGNKTRKYGISNTNAKAGGCIC